MIYFVTLDGFVSQGNGSKKKKLECTRENRVNNCYRKLYYTIY